MGDNKIEGAIIFRQGVIELREQLPDYKIEIVSYVNLGPLIFLTTCFGLVVFILAICSSELNLTMGLIVCGFISVGLILMFGIKNLKTNISNIIGDTLSNIS